MQSYPSKKEQQDTSVIFIKCPVWGMPNSGKTSLCQRLARDDFSEKYESSISVDFALKELSSKVKLQLWDVAGTELYKSLTPIYFRDADIIVFCYSTDNRESFEKVSVYLKEVSSWVELDSSELQLVLVGTKCDLGEERQVTSKEALAYAKKNNMFFFECSAKENKNVDALFWNAYKNFPKYMAAVASDSDNQLLDDTVEDTSKPETVDGTKQEKFGETSHRVFSPSGKGKRDLQEKSLLLENSSDVSSNARPSITINKHVKSKSW